MANRDHKARARPSSPPDGILTDPPGGPPTAGTCGARRHLSFPFDPAWASHALTRLRMDIERYRKAEVSGRLAKPLAWMRSGEFTACLTAAIHCLGHYAGMLGHEPAVTV